MSDEHDEVEAVADERGMPSPFEKPAGVVPSSKGGKWDADKLRKAENDVWTNDEDANDEARATDFSDDESEEQQTRDPGSEEEGAEQQVEEEEEERVEVEEAEEPSEPLNVSPRANDRIRQLAAEKKAAEETNLMLQRQISELVEAQKRQVQFQEQLYQEEINSRQLRAAELQRQKTIEEYRQLGFKDDDVGHQFGYEALTVAQRTADQTKAFIDQMQRQQVQAQQEASYKAYETALKSEVEKALPEVDASIRDALYQSAYALARAELIPNPSDAVKRVVGPIAAHIKKTPGPKQTKRPQPSDAVHKVVSTSGRAAGKSPGQNASGKKPMAKDVIAFLK